MDGAHQRLSSCASVHLADPTRHAGHPPPLSLAWPHDLLANRTRGGGGAGLRNTKGLSIGNRPQPQEGMGAVQVGRRSHLPHPVLSFPTASEINSHHS